MQRKSVIFVADSLDNAHKFQAVLSGMDADVVAGSSLQFKKLLHEHPNSDLIIFEASGDATQSIAMVEDVMVQDGGGSILIIVKEDMLQGLRLPVRLNSDFVVQGASADECALRIRQLLWPGNETSTSDFISIDTMTINLATYQVTVAGEPVDFTCLRFLSRTRGARIRVMRSCGACGASITSAARARWMCMCDACVQSWGQTWRNALRPFVVSDIFGVPDHA